jgi:hypothetical protein
MVFSVSWLWKSQSALADAPVALEAARNKNANNRKTYR